MKMLILLILLVLSASEAYPQDKRNPLVTASELKEWIRYLASDEMKGRANGSPEMKTAAFWLAEKFRENNTKPGSPVGDFIQDYSFTSRQQTVNERNVIGIIEGSDPSLKDQFIVLSAHFDHIGIKHGLKPDSICNGADDNAAGTCTVLGIARTIGKSKMKPGRSLVFVAFSGEESGMRGSRYFVSNPPFPIKNIYADLNFEMTGHSEYLGRNHYYMTGCLNSNLDDIINEYNKGTEFQLIDTITVANSLFYGSDNIAFSRISVGNGITRGIPSGTFATSALAGHLHSVNDEAELFDFDNMAALTSYFSDLVIWLSYNKSEIKWTDPKFSRPE